MAMTRERTGDEWFALGAVAVAVAALLVVGFTMMTDSEPSSAGDEAGMVGAVDGGVDLDDDATTDPDVDVDRLIADTANTMAAVTSVRFELDCDGAPVFIDAAESIALTNARGRFRVPGDAAATIDVTVDDSLNTRIGAVAIDGEVWISNPVTGQFEASPPGYDLDPGRFFDPADGWQPLIANLGDVELIDIVDRGGPRYYLRGVARADDLANITVGLVGGRNIEIELWIHPSGRITDAEFVTTNDGATTEWALRLFDYDAQFTITAPAEVDPS